jgi:hypothetical protein
MEPLHAADIADLLEQVNAADRRRLIGSTASISTARSCRSSTSRSAKR